jgi:TonB-linked SusC/RagA family outer membrane protein
MQFSFAQEKTVTGVVTENGLPIPGVTVAIQGTTVGTQTDFDGKYSIKAKQGQVLEFSYIGLKTQSITVGTSNAISVKMSTDDAIDLGEVIVVAYGTQTKESLTGSVAEIKAEEVSKITTGNVTQGLVGKVAGVQVSAGTGMPGDGATIRIRGIGSLSVGTPPLYVVDGVPFYGQINSINTQDIASMTILKDASAAALYGSRGASGVIIITTKKGKNRKSVITLDSRAGYASRAVGEYDLITSQSKYYEAYFQSLKNTYMFNGGGMSATDAANLANANLITGGQGLQYNAYNVANDQIIDPLTGKFKGGDLKYNEDFSDLLFGDGFFTQTSVSVAGGDENTTHYFSLGYEKNDGYVVNSGFEKITSRLKVDSKISDRFKVGANISYAHTEQNYLDGYTGGTTYSSPFFWVRNIAPIYPVYSYDVNGNPNLNALGQHLYDDGTGADGMSPIRPFGALQHPYATAINDYKKRIRDNVFASGYLDAKIVDNLVFTYTLTGELSNLLDLSMDTQLYGDAVGAGGRVLNTSTRQLSFTHQQLLKYNKSFGNHNFDVLAGHESLARNYDYVQAERSKLLFDSPNVDHGSVYQSNSGGGEDYFLEGYLARIAYDYNNKYYINLSGRRDGSSRFAPDKRWGTFFGAGASWRVSQEAFLSNVSWLNELKIKGSFGQQGNDEIGYNLPWLTPYTIQPTNDTALPIAYGAGDYLGNKDIKWETSTNMNFGFDTSLFNNRLNVEVEYFVKNISDMLFNRPIPVSLTGFTVRPENIGDMNNKGFELTMDGDIYRTNDWTVSLNFNATTYKNTITRLPSNGKENNQIISGNFIREENGGAYDYYMREYAGVNPANGAALFWMNVDDDDLSLGRQLTENNSEADLYRIGKTALPDVFGGFGTNIKYKGIDVGIDFAYQYGGYATDGVWLNAMALSPGGGLHSDFSKTWSVDNPTGTLPRVDTDDPNNYYGSSTLSLIKSDYLSIQNISAGYTFDTKVVEKLGLNKLRFYALADNVHLWSKRQGFDPRQSGVTGASGNTYSILRTISFGVNLEF